MRIRYRKISEPRRCRDVRVEISSKIHTWYPLLLYSRTIIKIIHPLGRISGSVSSKTWGGGDNEYGGFGNISSQRLHVDASLGVFSTPCPPRCRETKTLLGPQSRFGDTLLIIRVLCPHIWDCGAKGVKYRPRGCVR